MNPLLISGYGTSITVDKRKLIISNKNGLQKEFYPHQISYDAIVIDGHTGNISFEAIRWLMKHDIPITVLNWNGNLFATINPKEPNNGKLRIKQYEVYTDKKLRYYVASKILEEKVGKSLELLGELSRFYPIDISAVKKACENEGITRKLIAEKSSMKGEFEINDLLMYEGKIAMIYWENLSLIFNELYPEFHFENRKNKTYSWNMNASDEINALLNYGYAILESITRKNINTIGLDQSVGFLHELSPSKPPLVYDLQELYRWMIDLSVIQLLEEKKIGKKDFITTENYHIRLKPATAKLLIEKIQLNFNKKVSYKNKNYSYETIYQDNTQKLANFLTGKNKELSFEIPGLKYERNDDKLLREKLMEIPLKDAKKLGINKSTLWYIQKNIREGKKIELYDKVKAKIEA